MRIEVRAAVSVAVVSLLSGCPKEEGLPGAREPFNYPPRARRLDRATESAVIALIEDVRGREYLARVRAEDALRKRLGGAYPDERAKMCGYVVRLLDEPQVDVRASALKLLIEHGRDCPEAVAALVQVLGDENMSAPVRDGAARTLLRWAGKDFGYRAFDPAPSVRAAAERWRGWLEETGGRLPPQETVP